MTRQRLNTAGVTLEAGTQPEPNQAGQTGGSWSCYWRSAPAPVQRRALRLGLHLSYALLLDAKTNGYVWYSVPAVTLILNAGLCYRIGFANSNANREWQVWSPNAANTNVVLFGSELNHIWLQPNCSEGCRTVR
jgi:hypothetical protein